MKTTECGCCRIQLSYLTWLYIVRISLDRWPQCRTRRTGLFEPLAKVSVVTKHYCYICHSFKGPLKCLTQLKEVFAKMGPILNYRKSSIVISLR
jgi:hypothetical protein